MSRQDLSVVEAGEVSQLPITLGHVHEIHAHFGAKIAEQQEGERSGSLTNSFVQRAVQNMDKGIEYHFLTKSHADNGVIALIHLRRDGDVFFSSAWFAEGKNTDREYVTETFAAIEAYTFRCHNPKKLVLIVNTLEVPYKWVSLSVFGSKTFLQPTTDQRGCAFA